MLLSRPVKWSSLCMAGVIALAGCKATETPDYNVKPSFVGTVTVTSYDGSGDDLLTGGLGKTALQSATSPTVADAANPTFAELRRLAIYNSYRAAVDTSTAGGFGVLYGPNVDANGGLSTSEGLVPGVEAVTYLDDGTGKRNVTVLLQIPSFFNRAAPCLVTAASGGSRGVYGAVATAGEWALKRGCAVVYLDKGTGVGAHDLATNTVNTLDGLRKDATTAANTSNFTATATAAELAAYNAAFPNRIALKHAHSQQNSERDWGLFTLQAVEFSIYMLNETFSQVINNQHLRSFKAANVLVIASSTSEGAAAAISALEQDTEGLIDGLAVAQPTIQMAANNALTVRRGSVTRTGTGKALFDYVSMANLLQPCAATALSVASAPGATLVDPTRGIARCAALKAKGILTSTGSSQQAEEALAMLVSYGWEPESAVLHASHYALVTPSVAVTHANAYGRFGVRDNLCGFSFAGTGSDSKPAALAGLATINGTSSGRPGSGGISVINNNSVGGALLDAVSISPSTGAADYNIDGAQCLRNLFATADANGAKVQQGMTEVRRTGNLRGKPAIIVHGRADAHAPVGLTSRAYFGLNKIAEGAASKLTYIEVTNAQHFDAFNGNAQLAGYDTRFVPLQRYFNAAMDAVYSHLATGTTLPPSQVVRTVPRAGTAGAADAIALANVPVIASAPAAADQITFSSNTVVVPD